jgi:hypothetical protein
VSILFDATRAIAQLRMLCTASRRGRWAAYSRGGAPEGVYRSIWIQRIVRDNLCCAIRNLLRYLESRRVELAQYLRNSRMGVNEVRAWNSVRRHVLGPYGPRVETHVLFCKEARLGLIYLDFYRSR